MENVQTEAAAASGAPVKKKFKIRLWMIITASVLVAVITTVVILGVINMPGLNIDVFMDYEFVHVYDNNSVHGPLATLYGKNGKDGTGLTEQERQLQDGLKSTRYTILRSIFEWNWEHGLRYLTKEESKDVEERDKDTGLVVKNDDNTPKMKTVKTVSRVEYDIKDEAQIQNMTQPGNGIYVLDFVYRDLQSAPRAQLKVRDNSDEAKANNTRDDVIHFDRIRIRIIDTADTIQEFRMFVYDSNDLDSGEAVLTPVLINLNTTKLYEQLDKIREHFRGTNEGNGTYVAPDAGESNYN